MRNWCKSAMLASGGGIVWKNFATIGRNCIRAHAPNCHCSGDHCCVAAQVHAMQQFFNATAQTAATSQPLVYTGQPMLSAGPIVAEMFEETFLLYVAVLLLETAWFKTGPFQVTLSGGPRGDHCARSPLPAWCSIDVPSVTLVPECYLGLNHALETLDHYVEVADRPGRSANPPQVLGQSRLRASWQQAGV
jgi:hypothetical protein